MKLTKTLADEYRWMMEKIQALPGRQAGVTATVKKMARFESRYRAAGKPLGVPWIFIGIVHSLEGSFDFKTHLANGDPLSGPTVGVPKGIPGGAWEPAASAALRMKGLQNWHDWTLAGLCFQLERWNGFGQRNRGEPSDYLVGSSNLDRPGKYIADGVYNPKAIGRQIGAMLLLKELMARGLYQPNGEPGKPQPKAEAPAKAAKPQRKTGSGSDEPPEGWV